jgi:hypothetical protein
MKIFAGAGAFKLVCLELVRLFVEGGVWLFLLLQ